MVLSCDGRESSERNSTADVNRTMISSLDSVLIYNREKKSKLAFALVHMAAWHNGEHTVPINIRLS